jgi:hypothetical protein
MSSILFRIPNDFYLNYYRFKIMDHFLNNTDDHNSSFFQPPRHDDEFESLIGQHSPSTTNMEVERFV